MNLLLERIWFSDDATIGILFVDGDFNCFTLEDTVRADGVKVYGQTAIPSGKYRIIVNVSNRFKRPLPLLLNVPNFEGIRIHPGNRATDTEGCILPGASAARTRDEFVGHSRDAFNDLFEKLDTAPDEIWIEIVNRRAS